MIDKTRWEHKTYKLTCIGPVHVGNGELLKQYEYLYDQQENKVYFLDQTKWAAFLLRHGLLDDYAVAVENGSFRRQKLWEWLEYQQGLQPRQLIQKLALSSASVHEQRAVKNNFNGKRDRKKKGLNDIVRQVKNMQGIPYIPGSSIKGALRNAILWHKIMLERSEYHSFWLELKRAIQQGRARRDKRGMSQNTASISQRLEAKIFTQLPFDIKNNDKNNDALKSVMRAIQVSDAIPVKPERDTIILQKLDASRKSGKTEKKPHAMPLFRECIPAGRTFQFTIMLDKEMAEYGGIKSLAEIWQWASRYTAEEIQMQQDVFNHYYQAELEESHSANLLLGGGTGFLSKTVFYALAPTLNEGRNCLKQYFDFIFPKHHHLEDDLLTPRTLKLAQAGDERWLMGMAYIEEVH